MTDHVKFPLKKYRPRTMTERQIKFCEAYIAGESVAQSLIIAGYKANTHPHMLQSRLIQSYIAKRQSHNVNCPVTFEGKVNDLAKVVSDTIHGEKKSYDIGIRAISELNKMQGHYAVTKTANMNVNVSVDSEQASEIFDRLLDSERKDY